MIPQISTPGALLVWSSGGYFFIIVSSTTSQAIHLSDNLAKVFGFGYVWGEDIGHTPPCGASLGRLRPGGGAALSCASPPPPWPSCATCMQGLPLSRGKSQKKIIRDDSRFYVVTKKSSGIV
jgi:hypothetical protein